MAPERGQPVAGAGEPGTGRKGGASVEALSGAGNGREAVSFRVC